MDLKTFKATFSVTLVGFCNASAEQVSRGLYEALCATMDKYAMDRRLSSGESNLTVYGGEDEIASAYGHSATVNAERT